MALIKCPDCGRSVSSLAITCPDCARPIATTIEPTRNRKSADGDSVDEPKLGVGDLARIHREKVATRVPGVSKLCDRCGSDVAEDMFRQKTSNGYICADCQDAELDRNFRAREWRMRVLWVTAIVLLVGVSVSGAVLAASMMSFSKSNAAQPKR